MGMPDENIHPHATGAALETVNAHQEPQDIVFWSGWFCPFNQRSWISLEEKGIPYQYKEVNPYKKEEHFLKVNPLGLVPALEYHGRPLRESTVICEFLEDAFPERGPHLLPTDAYERARVRLAVDHISKKVIPAFFQTLQAPAEGEERADARSALYDALRTLTREVKGPYLVGEELSLADVAIAPFVVRDYVLRDHRGYVRADVGHGWEAYAARLEGRESVRRTSSELQYYEEIYGRYLRNEAQSDVAKATRGGKDLP